MTLRAAFVVVGIFLGGVAADAQVVADRRVEISAGGGIFSGAALGSADANLLANASTRQQVRLFTADSRFAPAPTWHVRAGFAFSRRFAVEGGLVVSHPDVRTSLSGDSEGAPAITIAEQVEQYFFEASLVIMLDELNVGSRTVPYAVVGGGYLHQLHEGLTVIERGQVYHAGGGIKHWLMARNSGRIRAVGLRADARLYLLASGISFDAGPRPHGAVSVGMFIGF